MASASMKVELFGLEMVQAILLAAYDLLAEVEEADEALVTDGILESARSFRETVERVTR